MRDKANANGLNAESVATMNAVAKCPHCGRGEKFDDELTARAWATGHILENHVEELPEF